MVLPQGPTLNASKEIPFIIFFLLNYDVNATTSRWIGFLLLIPALANYILEIIRISLLYLSKFQNYDLNFIGLIFDFSFGDLELHACDCQLSNIVL